MIQAIKYKEDEQQKALLRRAVVKRSDKLMNYFLASYFTIGLILAFSYDTWLLAVASGGISLTAYYTTKIALPKSDLYQYVLSAILGVFMAQYIYQMHGMFEMHFFAFIGSVVLITYQNWKLQIPMLVVVVVHHAIFNNLQGAGYGNIYFTELNYLDLQTFTIHLGLAAFIFFICGLWSYQLRKYSDIHTSQTMEMGRLHKEAVLYSERQKNAEALEHSNQQLRMSKQIAEDALREAEKERHLAEQANQAKSVFLATMSHEIRTPMNGVIGMSSLLSETSLTQQQQQYTDTITSCGESLMNVINDILDFSKIESGNMELEEEDFNLRRCIEDVLDIFGKKAAQQGLELIYEIDQEVPVQIIGDGLRLRQIITNLVSNAMKFTAKGEVFVSVHLNKVFDDETIQLEIKVADSGIGIPADKMERLFKAFSQVDSSTTRKYGGTGLGLVISQKLVRLMKGEIAVESTIGQGSTFSFTMITRPGFKVLEDYGMINMDDKAGKKVLVIDDNHINRLILKNQLESWKLIPVLAESGKEALALLSDDPHIDLVLLDMQMPEMHGIDCATAIRKKLPDLPMILLSSIGDECNKANFKLFKSILTKPIKLHILSKHVVAGLSQQESAATEKGLSKNVLRSDFSKDFQLNILVAEDNLVNQQVIMHILKKLGYQPAVVSNGLEAVEAATNDKYDLIFMDMQMPEMNGQEATRCIRESLTDQPIIIALTANTMEDDLKECMDAGMDDFLCKPIKLESLIKMLEKWAGVMINY